MEKRKRTLSAERDRSIEQTDVVLSVDEQNVDLPSDNSVSTDD